MLRVWIVTMESDGGDRYAPALFRNKPSKKELRKLVRSLGYDGVDDDVLDSYIHLTEPRQVTVTDNEGE